MNFHQDAYDKSIGTKDGSDLVSDTDTRRERNVSSGELHVDGTRVQADAGVRNHLLNTPHSHALLLPGKVEQLL